MCTVLCAGCFFFFLNIYQRRLRLPRACSTLFCSLQLNGPAQAAATHANVSAHQCPTGDEKERKKQWEGEIKRENDKKKAKDRLSQGVKESALKCWH